MQFAAHFWRLQFQLVIRPMLSGAKDDGEAQLPSLPQLHTAISGSAKTYRSAPNVYNYGEDAWFLTRTRVADVLGVADGVGGCRRIGLDPSHFSASYMRSCERFVHSKNFQTEDPVKVLQHGYESLVKQSSPVYGNCTACVAIYERPTSTVHVANLGDSGYIVARNGNIISRSAPQQHSFNTPYQLSIQPPTYGCLSDSPQSADRYSVKVLPGDVLLLASDGVFDNVPDTIMHKLLKQAYAVYDQKRLQVLANSIVYSAYSLSMDDVFMTPFAMHAKRNSITHSGGKPDDITVLLATVPEDIIDESEPAEKLIGAADAASDSKDAT